MDIEEIPRWKTVLSSPPVLFQWKEGNNWLPPGPPKFVVSSTQLTAHPDIQKNMVLLGDSNYESIDKFLDLENYYSMNKIPNWDLCRIHSHRPIILEASPAQMATYPGAQKDILHLGKLNYKPIRKFPNLESLHSRIKSPIMDASWSSALMGLGGNPMLTNGMKTIYSPPDQGFNQRKPSSRLEHTHKAGSPPRITYTSPCQTWWTRIGTNTKTRLRPQNGIPKMSRLSLQLCIPTLKSTGPTTTQLASKQASGPLLPNGLQSYMKSNQKG